MKKDANPSPEVIFQGNPPSIYAEGVSQLMLGFPNSRVMLFSMAARNSEQAGSPTIQNLACELVMPTPVLIDMCKTVLKHAAEASPSLRSGGEQWLEQVNGMLDSLQAQVDG
ncbi:hypothetical protein B9Z47_06015 [Limnohabitans sp. 2KL-1]|jgi:hypothetical protein|uniref:hypothetical protein n=1 Tax=Limnohabitans sp. 2KL-1 TaxID=1100699 RepID=UPI000D388D02|nr:hypothetical protein [Limnohabitans sp. 2KL-1]PUE49057.1 hypothetical protein B9Z47_06015 [Limnohabitans sp. 2KL-1]